MKEERTYRTPEQQIADLEAKIESVRLRTQRRTARKDPVVKETIVAVKALDRALAAGAVEPMKGGLEEARNTLAQVVAVTGVLLPPPSGQVVAPRKRKAKTVS